MVQKDYILRMIEMMALMVKRVREMITGGDLEAAHREVESAAARTGIELALGRQLDGRTLLDLFMPPASNVDPTNCMLFGEVLYLEGLRLEELGEVDESRDCFAKALLLLRAAGSYATSAGVRFPDTEARITELELLVEGEGPIGERGSHADPSRTRS